ncbi:MAG: DUF1643 domain-containing protein [Novosphingobium sp.]
MWILFAYRATTPADLKRAADPVGPDNDAAIVFALGASRRTILAWGNHASHMGRDAHVLTRLPPDLPVAALGFTQQGQPRHPLYLAASIRPRRWKAAHLLSPAAQCHAR